MEPISACIIGHDEERHLPGCLASLDFCEEIVLVDSGSTDRTREIARAHGARVVVNQPFPGHVEQKNLALGLASHRFALCLDCDERITPRLRREILERRQAGFPGARGYSMPRLSWYLGRQIRHGAFWPDRKIRLFDRSAGRWGGINPHDRVELDGPVERLGGAIEHLAYESLAEHLETIERFTAIAARALHARGRRARLADIWLRPPAFFLKSFLLKFGFLDGWRGLFIAGLGARYTFLKWSRLAALGRGKGA